jgi:phosphatidate phosphatase
MALLQLPRHFLCALCGIPVLLTLKLLTDFVPYQKQGFFCDDNEIRYPERADTIESNTMFSLFTVISVIAIAVTEYSLIRHLSRKGRQLQIVEDTFHPGLVNFFYFAIMFISTHLATSVACGLGKRTISRLRPNFLSVCQPNLEQLCPPDAHHYVENYTCNGVDNMDEYFSFPSGHSAHSAAFVVFLIIYLQKRLKVHGTIKALAHFFLFLLSLFICLSRVRDYKHRLSDVCGGVLLGSLFGFFFITYLMHNFRPNKYIIVDEDAYKVIKEAELPSLVVVAEKQRLRLNRNERISGYGTLSNDVVHTGTC